MSRHDLILTGGNSSRGLKAGGPKLKVMPVEPRAVKSISDVCGV